MLQCWIGLLGCIWVWLRVVCVGEGVGQVANGCVYWGNPGCCVFYENRMFTIKNAKIKRRNVSEDDVKTLLSQGYLQRGSEMEFAPKVFQQYTRLICAAEEELKVPKETWPHVLVQTAEKLELLTECLWNFCSEEKQVISLLARLGVVGTGVG